MSDYSPSRPIADKFLSVYTFRDAVDHVLDSFDQASSGNAKRMAMRAVQQAYQELPDFESWTYYRRRAQLTTAAQQTDGSIAYDHTGGANERQVTLTGATWPSDVTWYRLLIGTTSYRIASRVSSTIITLPADSNPGADVDAGTSYTLYRADYQVPLDFRRGTSLQQSGYGVWPQYVEPADLLEIERWTYAPQDPPWRYTIRTAENLYSGLVIEFAPPPSAARVYDYLYTAAPRPIRPFVRSAEYTEGTISGVSSTTVSGTSTAWTDRMVGCVIRFGTHSTNPPSGLFGLDDDSEPYAEQRIVTAVGSATSLTIDAALDAPSSYTSRTYSIGDPMDVEPQIMWQALLTLSEAHYARISGRNQKDVQFRLALAYERINEARGADARNDTIRETPRWWQPSTVLFQNPD